MSTAHKSGRTSKPCWMRAKVPGNEPPPCAKQTLRSGRRSNTPPSMSEQMAMLVSAGIDTNLCSSTSPTSTSHTNGMLACTHARTHTTNAMHGSGVPGQPVLLHEALSNHVPRVDEDGSTQFSGCNEGHTGARLRRVVDTATPEATPQVPVLNTGNSRSSSSVMSLMCVPICSPRCAVTSAARRPHE